MLNTFSTTFILIIEVYLVGSSCTLPGQCTCDVFGNSWNYTEVIDWTSRTRKITTNGCKCDTSPNHFSVCQKALCGNDATFAKPFSSTFELPLYPKFSNDFVDAVCMEGSLAVALNGVPIQGMNTGKRVCVAPGELGWYGGGRTECALHGETDGIYFCGNAVLEDGAEFDKCGGHTDIDGVYHYNVLPICLLQQLQMQQQRAQADNSSQLARTSVIRKGTSNTLDGGAVGLVSGTSTSTDTEVHSPQIGWALDGFPVYGPLGPHGIAMRPCDAADAGPAPYCLDVCNGLRAELPGVDEFLYRYYMGGPMASGECAAQITDGPECAKNESKCCVSRLPPLSARPYTIGCFAGCPAGLDTCFSSGERGTTVAYIPTAVKGPEGAFGGLSPRQPTSAPAAVASSTPSSPSAPSVATSNRTSPLHRQALLQQDSRYLLKAATIVRLSHAQGGGLGVITATGDLQQLPHSPQDNYIYGLALGEGSVHPATGLHAGSASDRRTLYFCTPNGVFSMPLGSSKQNEPASAPMPLVQGVNVVTLIGFNFASSLPYLRVTVKGKPCLGVTISHIALAVAIAEGIFNLHVEGFTEELSRTPLSKLICTVSSISSFLRIEPRDILLTANTGTCSGLDLNPLEVVVGATGRPSIVNASIASTSLSPYAVAVPQPFVPPAAMGEAAGAQASPSMPSYVYWSNIASNEIFRTSTGDNNQLTEIVVTKVPSVFGITVLRTSSLGADLTPWSGTAAGEADVLLFTSTVSSEGTIRRAVVNGTVRSPRLPSELTGSSAVLTGFQEPRGLAVDTASNVAILSLLDGDVYCIDLSVLMSSSSSGAVSSAEQTCADSPSLGGTGAPTATLAQLLEPCGQIPPRARRLLAAPTSSRLDGVAVVPPLGRFHWTEERIVAVDCSMQGLWLLRDTGGRRSRLLGRGGELTDVAVPRGVVGVLTSTGDLELFVTELLGRIWRILLPRSSSGVVDDKPLEPQLLLDWSGFSAADYVRNALAAAASKTGPPLFIEVPF